MWSFCQRDSFTSKSMQGLTNAFIWTSTKCGSVPGHVDAGRITGCQQSSNRLWRKTKNKQVYGQSATTPPKKLKGLLERLQMEKTSKKPPTPRCFLGPQTKPPTRRQATRYLESGPSGRGQGFRLKRCSVCEKNQVPGLFSYQTRTLFQKKKLNMRHNIVISNGMLTIWLMQVSLTMVSSSDLTQAGNIYITDPMSSRSLNKLE